VKHVKIDSKEAKIKLRVQELEATHEAVKTGIVVLKNNTPMLKEQEEIMLCKFGYFIDFEESYVSRPCEVCDEEDCEESRHFAGWEDDALEDINEET
jgi:myosin-crossreactive antigen